MRFVPYDVNEIRFATECERHSYSDELWHIADFPVTLVLSLELSSRGWQCAVLLACERCGSSPARDNGPCDLMDECVFVSRKLEYLALYDEDDSSYVGKLDQASDWLTLGGIEPLSATLMAHEIFEESLAFCLARVAKLRTSASAVKTLGKT